MWRSESSQVLGEHGGWLSKRDVRFPYCGLQTSGEHNKQLVASRNMTPNHLAFHRSCSTLSSGHTSQRESSPIGSAVFVFVYLCGRKENGIWVIPQRLCSFDANCGISRPSEYPVHPISLSTISPFILKCASKPPECDITVGPKSLFYDAISPRFFFVRVGYGPQLKWKKPFSAGNNRQNRKHQPWWTMISQH